MASSEEARASGQLGPVWLRLRRPALRDRATPAPALQVWPGNRNRTLLPYFDPSDPQLPGMVVGVS